VFLDMARAFDTVKIDGLLYKLTLLNFPSYLVLTISSYLKGQTFEASFQTATSYRRVMRAGVAQGGPVLFSLCQRHAYPLTPRRAGTLRARYGCYSHVLQANATRQLPEVVPVRPPTVVERMENHYQRLQQLCDYLHASDTAIYPTATSYPIRRANRMGRYNSLCWGDPR
jgi:hypothetical protein